MRVSIPVDPEADEARRWAVEELSKSEYRTEPATWMARLGDWLRGLFEGFDGFGTGLGPAGTILIMVVAAALIGLVVWLAVGPVRRSRRARTGTGVLDDDRRSVSEMERAAERAAASGDWDTAVCEIYRASVRMLDDRGVVAISDGMTADEAARAIAAGVPSVGRAIDATARDFDVARYGRGGLPESSWQRARDTHTALGRARRTAAGSDAGAGAGAGAGVTNAGVVA
ncbi:DUF4129 domain-containing protein [Demequina sp. NBRC 110051]|uniref:DUF4129 domain-containing protein n=1 Tax=Demequina sp. NBRC 110051 TaxID=1570340 RepID=UPI000A04A5A7|nr:DUF4129 domain-containing protein [Demequina sp. NBRC 110051]